MSGIKFARESPPSYPCKLSTKFDDGPSLNSKFIFVFLVIRLPPWLPCIAETCQNAQMHHMIRMTNTTKIIATILIFFFRFYYGKKDKCHVLIQV